MSTEQDTNLQNSEEVVRRAVSSRPALSTNDYSISITSGKVDAMFNSADTILALLKEAGELATNIPYIKAISGICIHILKMKTEVDRFRDKWNIVMADVEQINKLIEDYYEQLAATSPEGQIIPEDIQEAFRSLERQLEDTLITLDRCQSKRKRNRIWLVLNRAQLTSAIDDCERGVRNELQLLTTKLSLGIRTDTARILDAISKVNIVPVEDTVAAPDLRAPPDTMFGREREIQEVVTTIQQKSPARITILGPGGMGKTSLALSVLHHPDIASEFVDARYFVPCDAAQSAEALLLEMASALGIYIDDSSSLERKVLAFLRNSKCIICLDNFETPWDAQTRAVEELLAKITSIQSITVLVTMRGTERPAKTLWTQPFLEPLTPLSLEAALQTFEAISGKRDDYATKLVQAVECVPLAVYLLAYLAQSEGTTDVWGRWEAEHTSMVHRRAIDQLSSVDFSIMLSLQSPRMMADPNALVLLGILSMLPDGLQMAKLQKFQTAFANLPYMRHGLSTLRHNALVYSPQSGNVSVLSPIRLYMQAKHGPSVESITGLKTYYLPLASQGEHFTVPDVQTELLPEIGNLNFLLGFFFKDAAAPHDSLFKPTLQFCKFCQYINLYEDRLLILVSASAQASDFGIKGDCLFLQAKCCQFTSQAADAEKYYKEALAMHEQAQDLAEQAHDLEYIGRLYIQLSKKDEAAESLKKALELHTQVGNKMGQGYDLQNLGRISLGIAKFNEARDYLNRAQALHLETNTVLGQAYNIGYLGAIHMQLAEYEPAKEKMKQALELHLQVRDILGQANIVQDLGRINIHLEKLEEAEANFHKALSLHKEACDFLGQANDLNFLGEVCYKQNKLVLGKQYLEKALILHQQESNIQGQANDYQELAHILMQQADAGTATDLLHKALDLHKQVEDQHGQAEDLLSLGRIDRFNKNTPDAIIKFTEAKKIYTYCQDKNGLAGALHLLGESYITLEKFDDALNNLNEALKLHEETGAQLGGGTDLQQIGYLYMIMSEFQLAKEYLNKAITAHKSINHVVGQAYDYHYLGQVHLTTSDFEGAMTQFEKAVELYEQGDDILGLSNSLTMLGQIHMKHLHLEEAERYLSQALSLHTKAGVKYNQALESQYLGMIHTEVSQFEKAEEEFKDALRIYTELGLQQDMINTYKLWGQLYKKMSRMHDAEAMWMQAILLQNQMNSVTQ
ncbi:TPR-like protein [Dentipellis sp. KUC8613]|nr:TPR-like protein [Dentipellis sp. KUC8613]